MKGATPFQRGLGLRWLPVDGVNDALAVECDLRDDLRGPAGSLEGGVVATLVDVAAGSCAAVACKTMVATQAMTVSYLAPARVGPVRATAVPLRIGRSTVVVDVRVVDLGADDRLVAAGVVTMVSLPARAAD